MIQPIRKNVLVRPYPPPEFTEQGLIVPDSVKKDSNKVMIVEVGEMVTKVKKGQTGFRVKNWGIELQMNGEKYFMMDETAIIATV